MLSPDQLNDLSLDLPPQTEALQESIYPPREAKERNPIDVRELAAQTMGVLICAMEIVPMYSANTHPAPIAAEAVAVAEASEVATKDNMDSLDSIAHQIDSIAITEEEADDDHHDPETVGHSPSEIPPFHPEHPGHRILHLAELTREDEETGRPVERLAA